jgi:hypothetical protein
MIPTWFPLCNERKKERVDERGRKKERIKKTEELIVPNFTAIKVTEFLPCGMNRAYDSSSNKHSIKFISLNSLGT